MPRQVFDKGEFIRLADGARECLVVRRKGKVKIKLIKSRLMYVYVTNEAEAGEILKSVKVGSVEL